MTMIFDDLIESVNWWTLHEAAKKVLLFGGIIRISTTNFLLRLLEAHQSQGEVVNDLDRRKCREAKKQAKWSTAVADKIERRQLLLKNEGEKFCVSEEKLQQTWKTSRI
jgi:hypothetical protein